MNEAVPPFPYALREATLGDIQVIIHHRISMFVEMNIAVNVSRLSNAFSSWLEIQLPAGTYRGWLIEAPEGIVAAGAGVTILPWPPGPREMSGRLPFVYNVYTEREHRHRGLARVLMKTVHDWCREAGFVVIGLAASDDGRPLYQSLGYELAPQPYMFKAL